LDSAGVGGIGRTLSAPAEQQAGKDSPASGGVSNEERLQLEVDTLKAATEQKDDHIERMGRQSDVLLSQRAEQVDTMSTELVEAAEARQKLEQYAMSLRQKLSEVVPSLERERDEAVAASHAVASRCKEAVEESSARQGSLQRGLDAALATIESERDRARRCDSAQLAVSAIRGWLQCTLSGAFASWAQCHQMEVQGEVVLGEVQVLCLSLSSSSVFALKLTTISFLAKRRAPSRPSAQYTGWRGGGPHGCTLAASACCGTHG
jgi:hypothetical protein